MATLELITYIDAPVERCFDLARSVDVHLVSTQQTGEKAVAGKTTGLLDDGDEVTWRGKHFGMHRELTSRMTAFSRPSHFRDSMTNGPFKRFDHDHFFDADGARTKMTDRYDFEFGLGPLGPLIDRFLLVPHFRTFLAKRNVVLKDIAESERWRSFL
jgi:ligand-binding SRPBCC domain-containing protein